jgi:methionyl-tRNA formyltransferase
MKIIFMGTPEFSAEFLRSVIDAGHEVVAVVTQPDRPAGRGRKLTPPPVKVAAEELNLPVLQPENLKDEGFVQQLRDLAADLSVVVAFSILPLSVLGATRLGALNMHGSLLPRYRGAAPIQWAVANGDKLTGPTVFLLDEKMDHGPILVQKEMPINADDTAGDIFNKMVPLGCSAVNEALTMLAANDWQAQEQNHEKATPAPKLKKEDGLLDPQNPVQKSYNRFRGFNPWPGSWGYVKQKESKTRICRIHSCRPFVEKHNKTPGTFAWNEEQQSFDLYAIDGILRISELQWEGKKRMSAAEIYRGLQNKETLAWSKEA